MRFKKFFRNAKKPVGFLGSLMIKRMNKRHAPLSEWGFSHIEVSDSMHILDIGCGGGANIFAMLNMANCSVDGIDYSKKSVSASKKLNKKYIPARCNIQQGNVLSLPYNDASYNIVTAFETVYFWPDMELAFSEVMRVLKPNGVFMIVCEGSDPTKTEITDMIPGMTLYTGEDLKSRVEKAGFKSVTLDKKGTEWVCITGIK